MHILLKMGQCRLIQLLALRIKCVAEHPMHSLNVGVFPTKFVLFRLTIVSAAFAIPFHRYVIPVVVGMIGATKAVAVYHMPNNEALRS